MLSHHQPQNKRSDWRLFHLFAYSPSLKLKKPSKALAGLTLTDLLISLSIASILMVSGVPPLERSILNQKADNTLQSLLFAIQTTRNDSVQRNQVLTLCSTHDLKQCAKPWANTHMVFFDKNQNRKIDSHLGEKLIRSFDPIDSQFVLKWNRPGQFIRMQPNGSTMDFGTLTICHPKDPKAYHQAIVISRTGRARLAVDQNEDGWVDLTNNRTIDC